MSERNSRNEPGTGLVLKERRLEAVRRPRRFRVLIHNDDYTPMDFVVRMLRRVFRLDESEATRVMLHIHHQGVGVAGVYTHEVAETKVAQVHLMARQSEHPLMASMEPEDDDDDQ